MTKSEKYWENLAIILVNMKRFQKEVAKARKRWNIPSNGLAIQD